MPKDNSTARPVRIKTKTGTSASTPAKPYPEFPLFPHAQGYWAKKIRGKTHYFGPWADPDGALEKYLAQKDALHSGRKPREEAGAATVHVLVNRFLNEKKALVASGELSPRTWTDYKGACDEIVRSLGKSRRLEDVAPEDFALLRKRMAKKWGVHRLGKVIQCIRCVFKFGYEAALLATPMRFGSGFKRPSKKTLRLAKAKRGPMLFTAAEIRQLIEAAGIPLRAMVLLGINAGLGNSDCANLTLPTVDLKTGWATYPRPKTGVERRFHLWPETVQAIEEALARRPEPKEQADVDLVFITKPGLGWGKDIADSPVTKETRKVLDKLGIDGGRNFYVLRHTFRTVADATRDQPAIDHIMGHAADDMASIYRERISDDRLKAVGDYVRNWLFGSCP